MHCLRIIAVALAALPGTVLAAPPFDIQGLHIELDFERAVARAESLGGTCTRVSVRRGEAVFAECEYPACAGLECDNGAPTGSRFTVGSQPVTRVGLEAPDAESGLTRISVLYAGDSDVVEEALVRQYGPPADDTSKNAEKSWSNARRVVWQEGRDKLGLLKTIKAITLGRDPEGTTRQPEDSPGSPAPDPRVGEQGDTY